MIVSSKNSNFWVEGRFHESGRHSSGLWTPTAIDLDFISIEEDTVCLVYEQQFLKSKHFNLYTRDKELGPVIISIKIDELNPLMRYHVLLRLIGGTIYKCFSSENISHRISLEGIACIVEPRLKFNKLYRIFLPQAPELINRFDQHNIHNSHKIGILFQRAGQTTEEEILSNCSSSIEYQEFLSFLGDSVRLKSFNGFSGGLDTKNDLTGSTSIFANFQDREVMFHVSTLLPYDNTDDQQIQRKRHIGNDIVAIIFQEENAIFTPGSFKSHFLKVLFIIQPVKDIFCRTIYRLTIVVDQDCPTFNPLLPHPPVYLKNDHFRNFLFIKMINAEASAYKSLHFASLNCRARGQLLENLIDEFDLSQQVYSNSRFRISDRSHNSTIRRKLNYFFKASSKDNSDPSDESMSTNMLHPIKSLTLPVQRYSSKFDPVDVIRQSFELSDPPCKRFSTQLPMKTEVSFAENVQDLYFDDSNVRPCNFPKFCDQETDLSREHNHRVFISQPNMHCISLDEKSFSESILESLESNCQFLHSISHDQLSCQSIDPLISKKAYFDKVDEGVNCEFISEANLSSVGEFGPRRAVPLHQTSHLRCKSQSYLHDLPSSPLITDYLVDKSDLQNQIQMHLFEKRKMSEEISRLRAILEELNQSNVILCQRVAKQSGQIRELLFDVRLFAYYQKQLK